MSVSPPPRAGRSRDVTTSDPAISCRSLTKQYRRRFQQFTAVNGLNLEVPRGSIFGLLGPNGAGKTTTIAMVLGLIAPTDGDARVLGGMISAPEVRKRVGFVPEKFQLPTYLTATEFLRFHARLQGIEHSRQQQRIDECLKLVDLSGNARDKLKGFSKGMQQRAVIAQAMLGEPDLLVLDEPTSALDPLGRREVRDLIRRVHGDGTTVVLNSHILAEVEQVCDSVAILRRGELVHQGSIADLANSRLHVTVRCSVDPIQFRQRAEHLVHDLEIDDHDGATDTPVELRFELDDEQQAAAVASIIHELDGRLYSLIPRHESLEDLFIRLVEGGAVFGGQVSAAAPPPPPPPPSSSTAGDS